MLWKDHLIERIHNRSALLCIVGMGYVGLPLAVEFAEMGFRVKAVDVDAAKVESINRGESYIDDIPTSRLAPLVASGHLMATTNYEDVRDVDAVSICVPTPLRKTKDPDMSYIIQSIEAIASVAHPGMLVVLESTTYPGTTEEIIRPRLEQNGLIVGENVFIAFSPERIDPGNPVYGVRNTPKIVGGSTPACADVAAELYTTAVDRVIRVSSPTVAEMAKLLENTFRAVNIGMVNEMALMCNKLGIDVWEVINAAASKPFGFMPFYPGPGLGGHCIPVDPHYLSWKLKTLNYTARFIELASEINTSMPLYVIEKIADALNDHSKSVRGSRIVVLGVAYKRDVNDVRESPALDVIELLRQKGADVVYHDPHVPQLRMDGGHWLHSVEYSPELLHQADCVAILTDHRWYNWEQIVAESRLIVDTRHVVADIPGTTPVVTL